jgi:hypothetical protein
VIVVQRQMSIFLAIQWRQQRERSKTESFGAKNNMETSRQLSHSDPDLTLNSPGNDNQCSKSDIVSIDYKMKRTNSTRDPTNNPSHLSFLNVSEKDPSRRTSTGSNFEGNYFFPKENIIAEIS